ncbi:glycosyltransferase [Methylocapsa acidiphila]|uniref:glycosyltransferase n=1 Tax=Methylocapsa acidiphila TaxID=133552 RepID=UPI0003F74980|nr:glycosyltransferase [Methylocapsa acidiphila]
MEIIFLDNGLSSKAEHSYNLAKKVGEALTRRALRYRVFGMKSMDPSISGEIDAIPHFSRSLYEHETPTRNERRLRSLIAMIRGASFDASSPSELTSSKILNASFEKDLDALPAEVWSPANIIVIPAISQNQIFGLIRCLLARPLNLRPRVICQLMFPPTWTSFGRNAAFGQGLYRKAFRLADRMIGKTLFFTTENDAIGRLYRDKFGIETKILPIPFGQTRRAAVTVGRPRLGFFGYSKSDKGFHLLPEAIEFGQNNGLEADFTVQVQHGGWERTTLEAERRLRSMKGVRLIEGILSSDEYMAETHKIDVMLLPYDPFLFGLRGSGIFTESVASGRPIVASAGTFAAKSIQRGEAEGEVFEPYNARELSGAIARLLPDLAMRQTRAAERAKAFVQTHSADSYVDVLLAHANNYA